MPRPRFQNAPPELRSAILEAAKQEFSRRGYEAASLNRIIETAGLSKGSFYYYFDDKLDLAATVLVQVSRAMTPLLELGAITDATSFWTTMERFQRDALDFMNRDPSLLGLASQLGSAYVDHPELAAKVMPQVADLYQLLTSAWRRGQEVGAVRTDLPIHVLVAVLGGAKEGLLKAAMPRDRPLARDEFEALAAVQWDLFRRVSAPAAQAAPTMLPALPQRSAPTTAPRTTSAASPEPAPVVTPTEKEAV